MTAPSREAVEAARLEAELWVDGSGWPNALPWSIHRGEVLMESFACREDRDIALIDRRTRAALTAALPFLAPQPSRSDRAKAGSLIASNHPSNLQDAIAADRAAVRAEATLAGGVAEREAALADTRKVALAGIHHEEFVRGIEFAQTAIAAAIQERKTMNQHAELISAHEAERKAYFGRNAKLADQLAAKDREIEALREAAKIGKLWVEADIETRKFEASDEEIKGDLTISCGNSALKTINAALEMSGGVL